MGLQPDLALLPGKLPVEPGGSAFYRRYTYKQAASLNGHEEMLLTEVNSIRRCFMWGRQRYVPIQQATRFDASKSPRMY